MREAAILEVDVDEELIKIMRKMVLLRDQLSAPKTLATALNAAGRKVRKQIVADTKEQYAIKNKKILSDKNEGAPQLFNASASKLVAEIRSKGPMQDIMSFMTTPNSKTGAAAAKVLSSSSMKSLEYNGIKAFVTQFASGHVAIVQRDPTGQYSTGAAARIAKYGPGADMAKVKKLLSPAVPHLLANEEVRSKAEAMTYEYLQEEIRQRIEKTMRA